MVVLDASAPIRTLVALDPTIQIVGSFRPEELKTFEAVEVHQLMAAGGRDSVTRSYTTKNHSRDSAALSREVLDIIKDNLATARAFLIFTFKQGGKVDLLRELRRDLVNAGIDIEAKTAEGKPRFEFLTWGNQEGLNGYEHCDVVIMAGILHRSHLDIAASMKAQMAYLPAPTPPAAVREVIESEVAHVVYQGASRGSCRRVNNGKAQAMKLYLIHRDCKLRQTLSPVMPLAQWTYHDPKHLKKSTTTTRTMEILGQVMAYLQQIPESVASMSTVKLKKALNLGHTSTADEKAFTRALEHLCEVRHGWVRRERSVVRASVANAASYGFVAH